MVTICLQCGDEGFTNAFVYCVKCLNFAVHRYCLHKLPKTFDEFVWWVCDYCEVESTGLAHQKAGAEKGGDTGFEFIRVDFVTPLATVIEKHHSQSEPLLQLKYEKLDLTGDSHGQSEPLLQSTYEKLDLSEDSHGQSEPLLQSAYEVLDLTEDSHGQSEPLLQSAYEKLDLTEDSHGQSEPLLQSTYEKLDLSEDSHGQSEPLLQSTYEKLDLSEDSHGQSEPLLQSAYEKLDMTDESRLTGDCGPSRVTLKADSDPNLLAVVPKDQGCQIGSSQQIHEAQGVEVVAESSPLREGPNMLVGSSSWSMEKTKSSKKKKWKNHLKKKGKILKGKKGKNHLKQKGEIKMEDDNKGICFYCHKKGHWKRNCKEYLAFIKEQKKKNGISSSISPLPNTPKKRDISFSEANIAEQRFGSFSTNQTHEARMPLHSAGHEREAELIVIHPWDVGREGISQLPMAVQPSVVAGDCLARAEPLIDPIWRGSFNILNNNDDALEGFVAHLSSRACQKVYEEANMLPSLLHLEMLPKAEVWPKSFEQSEPTDDNIALYIFPADRRYERTFDRLVEEMTRREFAMRATVKNAELLIFTSTELPLLYWRFQNKYYLWGVFRGKRPHPPHAVNKNMFPNLVQDRFNESGNFPSYVNNMGVRVEHSLRKTCNAESPLSTLQHW